ncbi:uncharacterized protein BXZ73DRAFT_48457 [Epithele typhae]|uniref:uncharacterized protein n=1 Tax=Epithele typhae TaxID=378194 RepID=UPI002007D730|nr:uncharacterized protein BXZ73DRAFT_48457 [Epithele typhae]KAH9928531.1 hypothetical protein BXZ73DRAFT_48457 [Epithele typhae]
MASDTDPGRRRLPTLVHSCQREFVSLGQGWRYDLIRPVLEGCTPDTLLRFEQEDPVRPPSPPQIWKAHFAKEFPISFQPYVSDGVEEPESWRDQYYAEQEHVREKLEQISLKLKASRHEEEVRKKESGIKVTDQPPPTKRARTWGTAYQPKSLFQQVKGEARRVTKGVYSQSFTRPAFQTQRIVTNTASAKPPPPPPSRSSAGSASSSGPASCGTRVVVRTIAVPQKAPAPKTPVKTPALLPKRVRPTAASLSAMSPPAMSPPAKSLPATPADASSPPAESTRVGTLQPEQRSPPARMPPKKNPAASLFIPRSKAYSQVPRSLQSKS